MNFNTVLIALLLSIALPVTAWAQDAPADPPAAEEPATEPTTDEPATDEPASEPAAEEPVAEEPPAGPAAEEPPAEEPPAEEPPAEEPPAEEPPAEEPIQDDSSHYQSDVSRSSAPPSPFDKGRIRISAGGAYSSNSTGGSLLLSAGVGYFLIKGLELNTLADFWIGSDPFLWSLTPGLTYYLHQIPFLNPYVGAFYRHWFVGSGFEDFDSVGGRAGVVILRGPLMVGLGAIYEKFLSCEGTSCSDWYPEIMIGASF